ncbi:unnamed protein product [Effrenium voratum]|nr:unnamed protein product [Effrenium voratum]
MRTQANEAAKLAADTSKTVVEAEKMEAMNKQLGERDEELATLRKELTEVKDTFSKQTDALKHAEANYQHLLRSTTMQQGYPDSGAYSFGHPWHLTEFTY